MILDKNSLHSFVEWRNLVDTEGGVTLIDKEKTWTSFDVVAKLRKIIHIKKIGHVGTLDPLATGLLILCLGKSTKQISEYQGLIKKYSAILKLGATTISDDSEYEEENLLPFLNLREEDISEAIASQIGEIWQKPPIFSAKFHNGRRLYKYARENKPVDPEPSLVEISDIKILSIELPFINLEVECSKGTYIRYLARDIGTELGCGAYLYGLRRTKIGNYSVDDALLLQDIENISNACTVASESFI